MIILFTILGIIFSLGVAAFFDASEIAILSVDKVFIRRLSDEGKKSAQFIEKLHNNPEWIFAITLFSADISIITATSLLEHLLFHYFPSKFTILVSSTIMTILVLLFAQIIPKSIGLRYSKTVSLKASISLKILSYALYPIIRFAKLILHLLKKLGVGIQDKRALISRAEIILLFHTPEHKITADEYAIDMMSSSIFLSETPIIDVMTPIDSYPLVEISSSVDMALNLMEENEVENIPVYEDNVSNITGVIYLKDLFQIDKTTKISDLILTPLTFDSDIRLPEVIEGLRKHRIKLGLVYKSIPEDEQKKIIGVISLQDAVEQVVGEI
jgi:CBS domain containing-hemolysin-like protein